MFRTELLPPEWGVCLLLQRTESAFIFRASSKLYAEESTLSLSFCIRLGIFCGTVSVQADLFLVLVNGRYYTSEEVLLWLLWECNLKLIMGEIELKCTVPKSRHSTSSSFTSRNEHPAHVLPKKDWCSQQKPHLHRCFPVTEPKHNFVWGCCGASLKNETFVFSWFSCRAPHGTPAKEKHLLWTSSLSLRCLPPSWSHFPYFCSPGHNGRLISASVWIPLRVPLLVLWIPLQVWWLLFTNFKKPLEVAHSHSVFLSCIARLGVSLI